MCNIYAMRFSYLPFWISYDLLCHTAICNKFKLSHAEKYCDTHISDHTGYGSFIKYFLSRLLVTLCWIIDLFLFSAILLLLKICLRRLDFYFINSFTLVTNLYCLKWNCTWTNICCWSRMLVKSYWLKYLCILVT